MAKKNILILSIVFVIITVFSSYAFCVSKKEDVQKVTFMSVYPSTHQQYILTCKYLDMVEKATNGKLKFERYSSSQLVPSRQALDATGKGMIHILNSYSGYYSGAVPAGAMGFPGGWLNPTSWTYAFFNDPDVSKLVSDAYLKKTNVVVPLMHTYVPGSCFIMAPNKKICNAKDFKGKKIRSPGGAIGEIYAKLGAAGVTLIGSEWYTAMQRGTVDGVMGYPYAIRTYRLLEVAGSMSKIRMVSTICPMIFVNADFWKNLSKDLKDTMISVNKKWTWEVMMPAVTEEENNDWDLGKKKGLKIIKPKKGDLDKIMTLCSEIGQKIYLEHCNKQGQLELGKKIINKMKKAKSEWPAVEKKLLAEGKIKPGKYMYPTE